MCHKFPLTINPPRDRSRGCRIVVAHSSNALRRDPSITRSPCPRRSAGQTPSSDRLGRTTLRARLPEHLQHVGIRIMVRRREGRLPQAEVFQNEISDRRRPRNAHLAVHHHVHRRVFVLVQKGHDSLGVIRAEQERRDLLALRIVLDFFRRRVHKLQIQGGHFARTRPTGTQCARKGIGDGQMHPRRFLGVTLGLGPGKNNNFHVSSSLRRFGISRPVRTLAPETGRTSRR